MTFPQLVVTGASGFVGRHLLEALKEDHRIFALARRSQARSGAPVHPNIRWFQADIGHRMALAAVFREVRDAGGADVLVHLAAHYDFTGESYVEYWRTNVHGMRNVLELSRDLQLKRILFPSSLAACRLPPPGRTLDETSPPDGEHIYARTKRAGEDMLREFEGQVPSLTFRFAALFSDWCEYAPLYVFLRTWLSRAWNSRLLGGRGQSAIPYLHVREAMRLFRAVLSRLDELPPGQVLVASPDGAVSHRELFEEATLLYFGERRQPLFMPRTLCGPGMWVRDLAGRLFGGRPFERPWMARYVDTRMTADGRRTRALLGWEPRPRFLILRRLPFLIQNLRCDPAEWSRRNHAAMKQVRLQKHLILHALLKEHAPTIDARFREAVLGEAGRRRFPSLSRLGDSEHPGSRHGFALRHLIETIRSGERTEFVAYCRDLAERCVEAGVPVAELCAALELMGTVAVRTLRQDPEAADLRTEIHDHLLMTLRWGSDEVQEAYEHLGARGLVS
jgi:nucleoside-diphosphate-sugar epimerase